MHFETMRISLKFREVGMNVQFDSEFSDVLITGIVIRKYKDIVSTFVALPS